MKKSFISAVLAATLAVSTAQAADVGFDLNIRVGNQPPAVAVPVPVPAPAPVVVIEEPPVFVYPPALGFYVAVGVPYDIVLVGNSYYLHRGDAWYRSGSYNGPWRVVKHKHLPPGLRKHRFERISKFRDEEYRAYRQERDHYRGRHFRPDKHELKEMRKEEMRERKEEMREMKEERKHGKGHGKHDRD